MIGNVQREKVFAVRVGAVGRLDRVDDPNRGCCAASAGEVGREPEFPNRRLTLYGGRLNRFRKGWAEIMTPPASSATFLSSAALLIPATYWCNPRTRMCPMSVSTSSPLKTLSPASANSRSSSWSFQPPLCSVRHTPSRPMARADFMSSCGVRLLSLLPLTV